MNGRQRRRRLPCSMAAGLIGASPAAGASFALPCFVSGSPRSGLPRHVQPAAVPAAAAAAPAPPPATAAAAPPPPGAAGRPVSAATRGRGSRACPGGPLSFASLPSVAPRPAKAAAGLAAGLPSPGEEGDKGRRGPAGGGAGGCRPRPEQSRGAGGLEGRLGRRGVAGGAGGQEVVCGGRCLRKGGGCCKAGEAGPGGTPRCGEGGRAAAAVAVELFPRRSGDAPPVVGSLPPPSPRGRVG